MIVELQNNSAWANYMTRQSCTFFWLAVINRWGTSVLLVPAKTCVGKQWKLEQRTISPVATNSCIKAERQPHWERKGNVIANYFWYRQFNGGGLWMRQRDIKWMLLQPSNNTELLPTLIIPQRHRGICVRPGSQRQLDHRDVNYWPWQEQPFSCSAKARKNCCWQGL